MRAPRSGPEARSHSIGRPGVQERPALQPQRLAGRPHVDEVRAGGGHPLQREVVRVAPARVAQRRGRGAGPLPSSGGCQSVSVTGDGLVAQRVREHRGACRGDHRVGAAAARAVGWSSGRSVVVGAEEERSAVPGRLGVGQVDRGPGCGQRAPLSRRRPWGSPAVPVSETTTGRSRPCGARRRPRAAGSPRRAPAPGRGGRRGRGRGRAAARRTSGRLAFGGDPLQPQGRVDHRVRPARGSARRRRSR